MCHPVDVTSHHIVSIIVFRWRNCCTPRNIVLCVVVVVVVVIVVVAAVYKNTFMSHMTTGFEQKYEHDILIQKKK
jgi:hypothetical protein